MGHIYQNHPNWFIYQATKAKICNRKWLLSYLCRGSEWASQPPGVFSLAFPSRTVSVDWSSFRVTTYASSPGVCKTDNSEDYAALSRPIERDSPQQLQTVIKLTGQRHGVANKQVRTVSHSRGKTTDVNQSLGQWFWCRVCRAQTDSVWMRFIMFYFYNTTAISVRSWLRHKNATHRHLLWPVVLVLLFDTASPSCCTVEFSTLSMDITFL